VVVTEMLAENEIVPDNNVPDFVRQIQASLQAKRSIDTEQKV
jgi:hypothetical protein